jgi:predicted small lipoprotein YifL
VLRLLNISFGVVLLTLVTSFSGCGPKAPEKDKATLDQEAKELDKTVKDGESGL